tara:strand:+ start:3664 stop:4254 length:591 start_codon:yes stop_codon:yes gene_type:complete
MPGLNNFDESDLELMRGQVEKFKVSLTEEEMLNLLQIKYRWSTTAHIGGYPATKAPSVVLLDVFANKQMYFFDHDGYLDYDKWKKYYDLGFTMILSNVFDLTPQLRKLHELVRNRMGASVNANFYFANGKNHTSFPPHTHFYPVVVKQIYGKGYWLIDNKKTTLKSQEALYVLRNKYHSVPKCTGPRLSLTINLFP